MDYMRKKAVIFDLDGTLSDSIHSIKYSGDRTMEAFGYGPFSEEQYKYFVGDGAANLVKRALAVFYFLFCLYKSLMWHGVTFV